MRGLAGRILVELSNVHRRMLVVYFAMLGPRLAYAISGFLGRVLYRMLDPLRIRSEAQARAALGGHVPVERIPQIAETAFVQRIWNLTDLYLADRLLHAGTYDRFGGTVPEPYLGRMRAAQRRGQAAILLSGYYGSFDLLPLFLGFNGIQSSAVYLPHSNAAFDAYRRRIRGRSGVELIPIERASEQLGRVLGNGGTVAIIADHHAGPKGLPVAFLGMPTRALRSVGLLAWRYDADVVVAGIRRVDRRFRFHILVEDVITHEQWAHEADPVTYVTARYLRGLERMILEDPTQYLWAYPRWGRQLGEKLEQEYSQLSPSEA